MCLGQVRNHKGPRCLPLLMHPQVRPLHGARPRCQGGLLTGQNQWSQEPRARREGGRAQKGQGRLGGLQLDAAGGEQSGEAVACAFGSASWRTWWGQPWGCCLTRMDVLRDLGSLQLFARRRESGYRSSSHPAPLWDRECSRTFLHV